MDLVTELLPRHMLIIYDINLYFLQSVERAYPGDRDILRRMSIIEEGNPQQVRMAFLATAACHTVNGVAALHSHLIKEMIFPDFVKFFGDERFRNVTNGITPRRWLHQCNPDLSSLISETLGAKEWLVDLSLLSGLAKHAADRAFQAKWALIKKQNKIRLADLIHETCGIVVSPDALFDIHCKRIHEYKRQFMNVLHCIHRYHWLKSLGKLEREKQVPRVGMDPLVVFNSP